MLANILERFADLYSHLTSWVGTFIVFLFTFFGNATGFVAYICVACLLDLICGVVRSCRVEHRGILSSRLVNFVWKTAVYLLLFLCFILADKALNINDLWVTRIYVAIIIFSETISMLANLSVAFPFIGAFALIRKVIASEVAEKLKIEKQEIDEILNTMDAEKKKEKKEKE